MLYVSQPKGVGFSYCEDLTDGACVNNDLTAAQDAYDFFTNWFDAFPEYKKNDFYLTAESYGGIYIPLFMQELIRGFPNLKGAAIGDGCWGTSIGMCNFYYWYQRTNLFRVLLSALDVLSNAPR